MWYFGYYNVLLNQIVDDRNEPFPTQPLLRPITLVSATGGRLTSHSSARLSFTMGSGNVNHNFFIFDLLPEKVVLGMDFMAEKQAIINMEKALFEIPAYNINVDIDIDWSVEQGCHCSRSRH